jgi:hypothetical protein
LLIRVAHVLRVDLELVPRLDQLVFDRSHRVSPSGSVPFVSASHAARWTACHGVCSHPAPVALVGEWSIPPQIRGTIGEQSPCGLEVSFHRLRDRSSVDRYDSLRAIGSPKPVPQGLVAPAGVTAPTANGQTLLLQALLPVEGRLFVQVLDGRHVLP